MKSGDTQFRSSCIFSVNLDIDCLMVRFICHWLYIYVLLLVVPVRVANAVVLGFLVRRRVVEITTTPEIRITAVTGNLVQHLFVVAIDRTFMNLCIVVKSDAG